MAHNNSEPSDRHGTPAPYDPFARGPFAVGVRTIQMLDQARDRLFPCEVWYPAHRDYKGQDVFSDPHGDPPRHEMAVRDAAAAPGTYPLILFSHSSGANRRQSTFLCTHLSSYGYLVAENDTMTPLSGMYELFERRPEPKQMVILRRADHLHFVDNVEQAHESARAIPFDEEEMQPITELSSGEEAHLFVRGLTLSYLDASLKQLLTAQRFWAGDVEEELARQTVEAMLWKG